MDFDPASVVGERIAENAEYEGVRIRLRGTLGTARVAMQIDVGFGDAVVPGPVLAAYPTILDLPAPQIRGYTRESVVAEKFHAMLKRGLLNSRMRDFFDVWALASQFEFDGPVLASAIQETFARRGSAVEPQPIALSERFARDAAKMAQWRALLRRSKLQQAPTSFEDVVAAIAGFLGPVAAALAEERAFESVWTAAGPWSPPR